MGFAKLDLDTFDTMNLIPISIQQVLIYKAKAAECKRTGKTVDVSISKKFNDLKDFVFAITRPSDIYASRQLFDKIITYKDPGHKPEYFIEVTKLCKNDRFNKKKFVTKATTTSIHDSGSNNKFKKLQEQIKQSHWGKFKIVDGKVQTFLIFEDHKRCHKDKLCFKYQDQHLLHQQHSSANFISTQVEVKPSNDPANPLEQIRESDMVEFLCKKGYKVNYASITVDHITSPTVVHDQAKDDTENPFGDVPTFDNVAMINLSLFEKIYKPSEATCGHRILLQPIVSTGSHAGQNINTQLDSGADHMMINIKYIKKLQWDDHHFICKFKNLPIFEYNHTWNKLVKEQEDPIELPVPTLALTFQKGQLPPVNISPLISNNL
eukprot:m51a1_g14499 hypothetical protein (378) ;mRNA; f:775950-777643